MITLKLDEELEKKKKTAYELHKRTGLHQSVISKLKRNEAKMIALDVLDKICDALDCEPSDLIDYQPNNPKEQKPASTPETSKTTLSESDQMSVAQVVSYLGKSESSVRRYIKKYGLKAEKIGVTWLILGKDVLEFEQSDFYINEAKR
jgi:putative transcriptional regulator